MDEKNYLEELKEIFQAKEKVLVLIPPDEDREYEKSIFNLILSRVKDPINIKIGLRINEENMTDIIELMEKGIKVFHWDLTGEVPIGIYSSDSKNTLISLIGDWRRIPRHTIWVKINDHPKYHKGYEFLVEWFFAHCIPAKERILELKRETLKQEIKRGLKDIRPKIKNFIISKPFYFLERFSNVYQFISNSGKSSRIREISIILLFEAVKAGILNNYSLDAIIIGSIYSACKMEEVSISIKKIEEMTEIPYHILLEISNKFIRIFTYKNLSE